MRTAGGSHNLSVSLRLTAPLGGRPWGASDLDGLVGGEEVEDGFFDRGLEDAGEGGGVGVELGGVALGLLLQIAVYVVGLEIEDDDAVRLLPEAKELFPI